MPKSSSLLIVLVVVFVLVPIAIGLYGDYRWAQEEKEAIRTNLGGSFAETGCELEIFAARESLDRANKKCSYRVEIIKYSKGLLEQIQVQEYTRAAGGADRNVFARSEVIDRYTERADEAIIGRFSGTLVAMRDDPETIRMEGVMTGTNKKGEAAGEYTVSFKQSRK